MNAHAYSIKKLNFKYDTNRMILNDLTLDFKKGQITGIIGPNGSGKTTLIKNLSRILQPDSGELYLFGKDLAKYKQKDLALTTGVVFQERDSEFQFTVFDIVMMGRYPYKKKFEVENAEDYAIVTDALEKTNTYQYRNRYLDELSGGEKQRVLIARALAQEPKVLILDEPISHLDLHYQVEILKMIQELAKLKDMSIIVILHDLNFAYKFCDQLILLNEGAVFDQGTPEEVITKENINTVYKVQIEIIKDLKNNGYHIIPAY
ncbi:MAG: ABC transporter ATP-binding protein [Clostridiales bacterium]|nr:ABC transporter ATP-binding protein [Clostridiales bacterium]